MRTWYWAELLRTGRERVLGGDGGTDKERDRSAMAKVETVIEAEHKDGVGDGDGVCCAGFSRLIRDLPKFDLIHFFLFFFRWRPNMTRQHFIIILINLLVMSIFSIYHDIFKMLRIILTQRI